MLCSGVDSSSPVTAAEVDLFFMQEELAGPALSFGYQHLSIILGACLLLLSIATGIIILQLKKRLDEARSETIAERRLKDAIKELSADDIKDKFISRMKEVLSKHISDTEFSVDEFAREMAMSRSIFYEKVKTHTGDSPNRFILACRMQSAVNLLLDEKYTVTQVAEKVGFNNPSYFSKQFKTTFGVTPKEFRTSVPKRSAMLTTAGNQTV